MSDDGLIVLRTVRNLLAGNGPVFNVGERVEANTSTLWQYLIYLGGLIPGTDLALVALAWAVVLSTLAFVIAAAAGVRHLRADAARTPAFIAPAGALVYLALPPARDFLTSGLEWGLSIFHLALLWALALSWARDTHGARGQHGARARRHAAPTSVEQFFGAGEQWGIGKRGALLAFAAGLSWLVRPELALYGGALGVMLLVTHRHWRAWLAIFACALPVPGAYQLFRMGYYGLLTPHTAVAKSAADAAWASGFSYLKDFVGPYWLWFPLLVVVVLGVVTWWHARGRTLAVIAVFVVCGLLHVLYVLRVGGDFMHARMLLLPLFAVLLPVVVLPVRRGLGALAVAAGLLLVTLWGGLVVWRGHTAPMVHYSGHFTVVNERNFWTWATQREKAPLTVADYDRTLSINGLHEAFGRMESGDAMAIRYLENENPETYNWLTVPREAGRDDAPTFYMVNLGVSSMNAPLDVRVLDNIGLATPLAARQPRIPGERIGHDKNLSREWQAADSGANLDELPSWIDADKAKQARKALEQPEFQELFATYRDPLTWDRFWANVAWSLTGGRSLQLHDDPAYYLGR